MASLARWRERFDERSRQERLLILLAGLLLILFLADSLLRPLQREQQQLEASLPAAEQTLAGLEHQLEAIMEAHRRDPDAPLRERLARIQSQLAEADRALALTTEKLIPPERMAGVLKAVLSKDGGLTIVSLRGLGVSPLLPPEPGEEEPPGAWKHGMRLTVRGNYLDILRYLTELEALPWTFFWSDLSLRVTGYPESEASVTVYTISLKRSWIGV